MEFDFGCNRQAVVSGSVDSDDPDFHLTKYDYFGHGKISAFLHWSASG